MESYGRFAGVYDVFMDNVNYREWADYIIETLAQDGIRDGLVLELGCGTGTVTEMLADAGYDMIGTQIDLFCKLSVMVLSMPVLLAILDTISEFMI